ncbi:hypothetical protein DL93DRAFT_2229341 [Clavulina sp. PMI_390]|nr:hypothetical protein DL93DRAFT_2229341 [Clavulina sp. PMI_390]
MSVDPTFAGLISELHFYDTSSYRAFCVDDESSKLMKLNHIYVDATGDDEGVDDDYEYLEPHDAPHLLQTSSLSLCSSIAPLQEYNSFHLLEVVELSLVDLSGSALSSLSQHNAPILKHIKLDYIETPDTSNGISRLSRSSLDKLTMHNCDSGVLQLFNDALLASLHNLVLMSSSNLTEAHVKTAFLAANQLESLFIGDSTTTKIIEVMEWTRASGPSSQILPSLRSLGLKVRRDKKSPPRQPDLEATHVGILQEILSPRTGSPRSEPLRRAQSGTCISFQLETLRMSKVLVGPHRAWYAERVKSFKLLR